MLGSIRSNPAAVNLVTGDYRALTREHLTDQVLPGSLQIMTGMVLLGSIYPFGRHCWKFQGNLQFRIFKAIQRQSSCKITPDYSTLFQ